MNQAKDDDFNSNRYGGGWDAFGDRGTVSEQKYQQVVEDRGRAEQKMDRYQRERDDALREKAKLQKDLRYAEDRLTRANKGRRPQTDRHYTDLEYLDLQEDNERLRNKVERLERNEKPSKKRKNLV